MNILVFAIGLLALAVIILAVLVGITTKRIKQLTGGKSAESLESIIKDNNTMLLETKTKLRNQELQILSLKKDSINNIQNIGVIRFNPFKETGGSQSFAIAITDKEDNGVVISSLYARERVNVFAKPLVNGTSEYTLSDEEKEAIKKSQI